MKSNGLLITFNGNVGEFFYSIGYFGYIEKVVAYRLNKMNDRQ
jgi:hypothetical protein